MTNAANTNATASWYPPADVTWCAVPVEARTHVSVRTLHANTVPILLTLHGAADGAEVAMTPEAADIIGRALIAAARQAKAWAVANARA